MNQSSWIWINQMSFKPKPTKPRMSNGKIDIKDNINKGKTNFYYHRYPTHFHEIYTTDNAHRLYTWKTTLYIIQCWEGHWELHNSLIIIIINIYRSEINIIGLSLAILKMNRPMNKLLTFLGSSFCNYPLQSWFDSSKDVNKALWCVGFFQNSCSASKFSPEGGDSKEKKN